MAFFLAGDVGGTKTRLAIYEKTDLAIVRISTCQYRSAEYKNLSDIVTAFLSDQTQHPLVGCIGVPGPVVEGEVRITNLPWNLSESSLEKSTKLTRLRLVNDLVATAAALPHLQSGDIETIKHGEALHQPSVAAVIAPGTGMGMGFLLKNEKGYHIFPSEGGHAGFAPANQIEEDLLHYLRNSHKGSSHVSVEDLLCGPGLKNIFDFVLFRHNGQICENLSTRFQSGDPAAAISEYALAGSDPYCIEALELFVGILGSHCGNIAVTTVATGGIYLGGGVPPKIAPLLNSDLFRNRFLDKGKMASLVARIPVYLIKDDYAALVGASSLASEVL